MIGDDDRMDTLRRQGRRLAWLMAGAAIGLAVVLLIIVVVTIATGRDGVSTGPLWLLVGASLLLAALLGLVPGVRELEVTGARSMLGAEGEMLVPLRPRPAHLLRTSLWVVLHLLLGLLVTAVLATFVPTAVLYLIELVRGQGLGSGLPLPGSAAGRWGAAALAVLAGAAALLAWWPIGALLARLAPRLLGPTTTDRLQLAQQRADREAERTRIARELHDGIGHALTVVSVQAAAARAVQAQDPQAAARALAAIEDTARTATGELDAVLALLREEEPADGTPADGEPADAGAARAGVDPSAAPEEPAAPAEPLADLLAAHRRDGMDLQAQVDLPSDLAPLQRRHLERCLAELLTNAQRHGGPGPVRAEVVGRDGRVLLEVTNPLPADLSPTRSARGGGRGLLGLRERATLFGGTVEAGPQGGVWTTRLDLPLLRETDHR